LGAVKVGWRGGFIALNAYIRKISDQLSKLPPQESKIEEPNKPKASRRTGIIKIVEINENGDKNNKEKKDDMKS
jgi:hypothetical protein